MWVTVLAVALVVVKALLALAVAFAALCGYACLVISGSCSRAEEKRGPLPPNRPVPGSRRLSEREALRIARRIRHHAELRSLWGTPTQRRR